MNEGREAQRQEVLFWHLEGRQKKWLLERTAVPRPRGYIYLSLEEAAGTSQRHQMGRNYVSRSTKVF